MYGALYVDSEFPERLIDDPNVPQIVREALAENSAADAKAERPNVVRAFLPDAGPAAIAVALPGDQNFCWDAGNCRLRYLWSGEF